MTTAVVMAVAGIVPSTRGVNPFLRLFDTLIGIAVGVTAVRISKGFLQLEAFQRKHRSY
jgi:hypothetical protein